jgi:hypothetical protein
MEQKKKNGRTKESKEKTAKKVARKRIDPDIQKLSTRVRALRKKQGYTNADFWAYERGWSRSHYGRIELGEDIRFSTLMKLIRDFGMTPQEFFAEGFEA